MTPKEISGVRPFRIRRGKRKLAARWGARLLALIVLGPALAATTEVPKVRSLEIVDKARADEYFASPWWLKAGKSAE